MNTLLTLQVFSNFQEVCLRVEESQIEEVFRIITRVNGAAQAELLQMLRALTNTKVDGVCVVCVMCRVGGGGCVDGCGCVWVHTACVWIFCCV